MCEEGNNDYKSSIAWACFWIISVLAWMGTSSYDRTIREKEVTKRLEIELQMIKATNLVNAINFKKE